MIRRAHDDGATTHRGRFAAHERPESSVSLTRAFNPRAVALQLRKIGPRLERENPGLTIGFQVNSSSVSVRAIVVTEDKRGAGVGRRVFAELFRAADAGGWPVTLTPSDAYGGDVARLHQFYAALGFEPTAGFEDELVRLPAAHM